MDGGAWWAAVHGVARVGHDWATSLSLFTFTHWRRKWQPTPVFLPGESQGREAWWAAVYGAPQSQTRLKQHSSSSSSSGKESTCQRKRCVFDSWARKIPWRREWQSTPAFWPGKSMDRGACRATVYGVAKESNMTYRLNNNNSKHMESSQTRDQTHVPWIGRGILNHWTTMEVLLSLLFNVHFFQFMFSPFASLLYWATGSFDVSLKQKRYLRHRVLRPYCAQDLSILDAQLLFGYRKALRRVNAPDLRPWLLTTW